MRVAAWVAGAAVLVLAAVSVVHTSGASDGGFASSAPADAETVRARGNFSLAEARSFARFPLYSLGASFDGLPLVALVRADAEARAGETVGADHVTFVYGTCESVAGNACQPPLQVQVWNTCERNETSYDIEPDESLALRGVHAAFFERSSWLELFTRDATIVLFSAAGDRKLLLRAGGALAGINNATGVGQRLAGGRRRCA